jgi:hypothetical protein
MIQRLSAEVLRRVSFPSLDRLLPGPSERYRTFLASSPVPTLAGQ